MGYYFKLFSSFPTSHNLHNYISNIKKTKYFSMVVESRITKLVWVQKNEQIIEKIWTKLH